MDTVRLSFAIPILNFPNHTEKLRPIPNIFLNISGGFPMIRTEATLARTFSKWRENRSGMDGCCDENKNDHNKISRILIVEVLE